jgi:alpha-mannosidase
MFVHMKKLLFLLLAWSPTFAQQTFTAIQVEPTVAYLQSNHLRMARLLFHGGNSTAGMAYISFNGLQDSISVPGGLQTFELSLPGPAITKEVQLEVRYQSQGRNYTARSMVSPARTWTVYILPHSHVDVGYTNVQEKVLKIHMSNIDTAISLAERTQNYPADARFKWNTEAVWVVDNYLARADDAKKKRFWDAVAKGWINIDASYGNINTSATSAAQQIHQFKKGMELAKAHGLELHSMFQGDVPGASWGIAAQSDITGVHYFLSAPNASDRIGAADTWRDHPFYWQSPSGGQQVLFWQCSPYSIGYAFKGSKIPNFFTVDEPKPYYTGKPDDYFLNPFLFNYLGGLEKKPFPYDMTLLTWAISDNAPLDPELSDAVKNWNEKYASPHLVITSVPQFFQALETKWKDKIPTVKGDYTEYWTDGIASAARETGLNRNAADWLQQAGAIWALRNKPGFPTNTYDSALTDLVMFNEHTWGAYNSVWEPNAPGVLQQWAYKKAFVDRGSALADSLLKVSLATGSVNTSLSANAGKTADVSIPNAVDVYNAIGQMRTALAIIPAALSQAGDQVLDSKGHKVPSQRLSTGELAILVQAAPFSKQRFTIHAGKATAPAHIASVKGARLQNEYYTLELDSHTGNITTLQKTGLSGNLADSTGLNEYVYLPGDSLQKLEHSGAAQISIKEAGPLVVSLLARSDAPGANSLQREVMLVAGEDQVRITNTIDKKAIGTKEAVHFVFPFKVPGAQVHYSIPAGSITAEADQLPYSNRNWYTLQRWADVSNGNRGVTWSSPDAPLFQIGGLTTEGLLGSLENSDKWIKYMEQSPLIASWVMNNLWHTNFRRDQEGVTTFHYYIQAHGSYNALQANEQGLNAHQPLVVSAATGGVEESLFFNISSPDVYVESMQPAKDGQGVILELVNSADHKTTVLINSKDKLNVIKTDILEASQGRLSQNFELPAKGVIMIRVMKALLGNNNRFVE